jgi:hypothetical protein
MKRDVGFLWSSSGNGTPRHFMVRLGEGVTQVNLNITEDEAKDLFGQMLEYRNDWKMPVKELTSLEKEMGAALQGAWDYLGSKGTDRPAKVDQRIMDALEAFKKAQQGEDPPPKPKAVPLKKTEARDLVEIITDTLNSDPFGKKLQPHVRKNLEEAKDKLQDYVWPGQCGPWGCRVDQEDGDCNNIPCEKCRTSYVRCKCVGGPDLRVRN